MKAKQVKKDGIDFMVRRAAVADAAGIIAYAKILFASTDQVLTTPEEYTITHEQEIAWINSSLQNPDSLILVVQKGTEIIGLLDFFPKPKRKNAHSGEFGVSVHPDYQGRGIGKILVETLLQWATANVHIEKIFLNVMATNHRAIELYRKLGFKEEGRHIKAIKQLNGEYVDLLQMYYLTGA